MMEDLTLEEAIDRLTHQDAFDIVISELISMGDAAIDELQDCPADRLQSIVGKVLAYREILALFGVR